MPKSLYVSYTRISQPNVWNDNTCLKKNEIQWTIYYTILNVLYTLNEKKIIWLEKKISEEEENLM